ncbi:MAG: DUF6115 domain-containing protein [Muribaculaceae bacterium]|nr:DUF6115 domain-containing protein [Muribaculaceae bacterium]
MVINMGVTEIILIIAGVIAFALGYILPTRKRNMDEELQLISEDEVRKLIDRETEGVKEHIADIVDETITYAMEKAERSMERLTNEKIMAINEYSDTVIEEINKNHKEVLFLYDMLNDKDENLKSVVSESMKLAEEIKQTVRDAEITAGETQDALKETQEALVEMQEALIEIQEAVKRRAAAVAEMPDIAPAHAPQMAEVQEPVRNVAPQTVDMPELEMEAPMVENPEAETFVPFIPQRVEIVHGAEGDYVASEQPELPVQELFDFAPAEKSSVNAERVMEEYREETPDYGTFRDRSEEIKSVDLRFVSGKENTRNSNDRILELHKAGKSNMAIARELGLGIGEVKLVIDLFEGL